MYFERQINLLADISAENLSETIQNIENFQQNVDEYLCYSLKTGERDVIT